MAENFQMKITENKAVENENVYVNKKKLDKLKKIVVTSKEYRDLPKSNRK